MEHHAFLCSGCGSTFGMGQKSRFAGDNVMLWTKRKEYFMITRIIYHMRKEMIVEICLETNINMME